MEQNSENGKWHKKEENDKNGGEYVDENIIPHLIVLIVYIGCSYFI